MKKILLVLACTLLLSGCGSVELKDGEKAVVTFKDEEGISSNELYETLKDLYGVDKLVEIIDTTLLEKEYENTAEETTYINQSIASVKQTAESYGLTFENYLSYAYGLNTEDAYKEYVRLNYRRTLWTEDHAKKNITEKQINDYYEKSTIGEIEASHILITSDATSTMTEDEKSKAEETARTKTIDIIKRLDKGEKIEDLAKEFSKDTGTASQGGYLGYFDDLDNYDPNFLQAAIALKKGEYSKTPVKSQFGYHIIYKTDQKEKPKLEDVKDGITTYLAQEFVQDANFQLTAIKALREKYEMKIVDSELDSAYEKLITNLQNQANSQQQQ